MSVFDRLAVVKDGTGSQTNAPSNLKPRPRVWRVDELISEEFGPSECFLAKDLLTKGDICLVAGRRKSGKTYLIFHLVRCICEGAYFGHLETRQGRILYLSQEMSEKAVHRRLKKLWSPEEFARFAPSLHIVCKYPFKLDSPEGAQALLSLIKEAEEPYDGIVIDALRDVKGKYRESDNDEMGELMVRLRDDVCLPADVFCILIHHMGKPDQNGESRGGRGASVIEDVVAEAIYIERVKDQSRRRGTFGMTREGELEGSTFWFEIQGDEESKKVNIEVGEGETDEDGDLDLRKMAEWISAQTQDVTYHDVMAQFSWKKSNAYKHLKRAVNLGLIAKRKSAYGPALSNSTDSTLST